MVEDISNKTLAALLAVAIVVSLGGTLIVLKSGGKITGWQASSTETGTAQVTISGAASIFMVNNLIDFGSGYVNTAFDSGVLSSGSGAACAFENWVNTSSDGCSNGTYAQFVVRNDGNVNLNVTMNASLNATAFIGGTLDGGPEYNFTSITATTSGGCQSGNVTSERNIIKAEQQICDNLTYGAGQSDLEMDLHLRIPKDASPGARADTLTFTGYAV